MKYRLNSLIYCLRTNLVISGTRRYAGHSKWQNIKHTKEENDAQRSDLFRTLVSKMTIAVTEGGSADPIKNAKLANVIDQAKTANMPIKNINAFLDRMQRPRQQVPIRIVPIRSVSKSILILHVSTSNFGSFRPTLGSVIKKNHGVFADSALAQFNCVSYVLAAKNCDIDQAMNDAIQIGAEDVEELNENNFKFECEFLFPNKIQTQLVALGYTLLSTEDTCIPISMVELNEEDLEKVNKLKTKILQMSEVVKVEDNIVES